MSQHGSKRCPDCGGTLVTDSGINEHTGHSATHGAIHGLQHGNPLMLLAGAGVAVARKLWPQKLVCKNCGYSRRS